MKNYSDFDDSIENIFPGIFSDNDAIIKMTIKKQGNVFIGINKNLIVSS